MSGPLDADRIETMIRENLVREGRTPEEIEEALRELRSRGTGRLSVPVPRRYEYRSEASILGVPLVHIVIGRDPQTGRVGKAFGVIAIGRIAFGVIPIGQIAVGVAPIGQLAIGLAVAVGQGAFAGYHALGQIAVATTFALGQIAAASSAIGQIAAGRHVLAQVGWGRHVWSMEVKDPVALEHFREMFDWVMKLVG